MLIDPGGNANGDLVYVHEPILSSKECGDKLAPTLVFDTQIKAEVK